MQGNERNQGTAEKRSGRPQAKEEIDESISLVLHTRESVIPIVLIQPAGNNKSKSSESPGELASTKKRRRTSGIGEATCSNRLNVGCRARG